MGNDEWAEKSLLAWEDFLGVESFLGIGNERDGKSSLGLKSLGSKSIGMGNPSRHGKVLGWEVFNGVGNIHWGRKYLEK